MNKNIKIYGLKNKINEEIFYVGSTKLSLKTRLHTHKSAYKSGNKTKKQLEFIENVGFENIEIVLLEDNISEKERIKKEDFWFEKLSNNNILINSCKPSNLKFSYLKNHALFGDEKSKKINSNDVVSIIDLYINTKMDCKEISKKFGVSAGFINNIINGRKWKSVTGGNKIKSKYPKRMGDKGRNEFLGINNLAGDYKKTNRVLVPKDIERIVEMYNAGVLLRDICKNLNLSIGIVSKIIYKKSYKEFTSNLEINYRQKQT